MWPALAHQKPGRLLVVLVVPVSEPGRGCSGDRASRKAHAAVPGSSEPSGQSQLLSLIWEGLRVMVGLPMQAKEDLVSKNLATARSIVSHWDIGLEKKPIVHLHSGPTPRGKSLAETSLPWWRALRSTNASIRRIVTAKDTVSYN